MEQEIDNNLSDKLIYIVECSEGQYEDHYRWNAAIFESKSDAERYAKELSDKMERIKDIPNPIDKPSEDMNEEELKVFEDWNSSQYEALEWNYAEVKEYRIHNSYAK